MVVREGGGGVRAKVDGFVEGSRGGEGSAGAGRRGRAEGSSSCQSRVRRSTFLAAGGVGVGVEAERLN